jgi:organic hydroperoxide reductase OsmC/OhrA
MGNKNHEYLTSIKWTGNRGTGTSNYRAYDRSYTITFENKPEIQGSSDPAFLGDQTRHNPEELLVASISSCHMLWYLHLCAEAKITVTDYRDTAKGTMIENADGSGIFKEVTLFPVVTITEKSMIDKANELHKKANKMCFIANSLNFPVHHKVECRSLQ